ncbi:hypothetical protein [Candidatus Manganitrophus noduliformans]|uniref:Uncharacterized protein n=1 Tax=Candidatus Manganitrophus noduliformans TaxID=2606439 RepID=A0A7X6IDL7_9BACT|nr:hypothetical protein [Candidatus Manganitrophus noduliformans]NKE73539.1 hypothetical protein [Candidatus Manganitrophus noduliformans]
MRLDVFPDRILRAQVAQIAPAARIRNDLAGGSPLSRSGRIPEGTRPGLTTNAEIITQRRSDILLLPQEGVRKEGERWGLSIRQGETVSFREVAVGATDGKMVEIPRGDRGGDRRGQFR